MAVQAVPVGVLKPRAVRLQEALLRPMVALALGAQQFQRHVLLVVGVVDIMVVVEEQPILVLEGRVIRSGL